MNAARPRRGTRFAGRRLSPVRAITSVAGTLALLAVTAGAVASPFLSPAVTGVSTDGRWFAGYYDVTLEDGEKLARSNLGVTPGGVVLSFVVAAGTDDCTPTWGKAYGLDEAASLFELDRRVARLTGEGRPVAVSFGGAINTELAVACSTVADLTEVYRDVIDRYGVDTIDLDIEGRTLSDTGAAARRATAVAALQRERADDGKPLAVWLTLPVAPDGLTAEGIALVTGMLDAGVSIAGVNVMTMNYGLQAPGSLADVNAGALQATADQLTAAWRQRDVALPPGGVWSMMGATPMIGRNDVATEVFSLDDARALNAFAAEKGMARLSMWSTNRDHTCGTNYANRAAVSNECSGVEQAGVNFADLLADGYTGDDDVPARTLIADDPETSPYPIWSSMTYYSAGVKIVWNGSVYMSKWWNEDGPRPDDPSLDLSASAWTYLGPVLETDLPFTLPQLPPGTYPEWGVDTLYNQGDRVMLEGTGYEARWWSRGQSPDRSVLDRDYSPWKMLEAP
ncbi:chitinase [Microbacterium sp. P07]|uniref:chitinase n=1 Tax=Microbacterium sp. P07 TaxID=3366952 RepID=UPI0037452D1C